MINHDNLIEIMNEIMNEISQLLTDNKRCNNKKESFFS